MPRRKKEQTIKIENEEKFPAFPLKEREAFLRYLSQHETEINFVKICSKLSISYIEQFLPALDIVLEFRNQISQHLEQLKYFILDSINDRALGKGDSTMPLGHAKFMLDAIDSQMILPRLKLATNAPGENQKKGKFEVGQALRNKLGLASSVTNPRLVKRLDDNENVVAVEEDDEVNEQNNEETIDEPKRETTNEWDLPDKF